MWLILLFTDYTSECSLRPGYEKDRRGGGAETRHPITLYGDYYTVQNNAK